MDEEKVELHVKLLGKEQVIDLKSTISNMIYSIAGDLRDESTNVRIENGQLKDEIRHLKSELAMAHEEIENLNNALSEAGVRF